MNEAPKPWKASKTDSFAVERYSDFEHRWVLRTFPTVAARDEFLERQQSAVNRVMSSLVGSSEAAA
jgi:hypothetical protein